MFHFLLDHFVKLRFTWLCVFHRSPHTSRWAPVLCSPLWLTSAPHFPVLSLHTPCLPPPSVIPTLLCDAASYLRSVSGDENIREEWEPLLPVSVAGAEVGPEEKWTERPGPQDHSQGRTPGGEGGGAATPPAASESRLPELGACSHSPLRACGYRQKSWFVGWLAQLVRQCCQ